MNKIYQNILNQNKTLICPKCKRIPKITILRNIKYWVRIQCSLCNYDNTLPLSNYITIVFQSNKPIIKTKCERHNDKQFEFYCGECKYEFCSDCIEDHKNHWHTKLSNILPSNFIQKLKDNITKAENHINLYNNQLKNQLVSELQMEIRKIEYAFRKNYSINSEMIHFMKMLIQNYTEYPKYYSNMNLHYNNKFVFRELKLKENTSYNHKINSLISYYNGDYLLNCGPSIKRCDLSTLNLIKKFQDSTNEVGGLILLKDNRLAYFFRISNKIYAMNLATMKSQVLIEERLNSKFTCMTQLSNGQLITGNSQKILKVWELRNYAAINLYILSKHTESINKIIELSGNRFASCSNDKKIRIFRTNDAEGVLGTIEDTHPVGSILQIDKREVLLSLSFDNNLKFWNLNYYNLEFTLFNIRAHYPNSMIQVSPNRVMIGTIDNTILVVNVTTFQIESTIKDSLFTSGGIGINSFLKLDDTSLLIGCPNGNFCLLDSNQCKILIRKEKPGKGFTSFFNEKIHIGNVVGLTKIGDNAFASAATNGEIKIWKYEDYQLK